MRYLIAILLPFLSFFTMGKVVQGLICLILQLTVTRGLAKHSFTIDAAVPPPARADYVSASLLRGFAPLVILSSCVLGLAVGDGIGSPLAFLAIAMFVGSYFIKRRTDLAELPEQSISFERLLDHPRFTIFAIDPARAKSIDD